MIDAGKLDRVISIKRSTTTVDDAGTPVEAGASLISPVRAQLIQSSTEEAMRGFGESSETVAFFRIRYRDGLTTADRVVYKGREYDLIEIKELGRREGLELRCKATRG